MKPARPSHPVTRRAFLGQLSVGAAALSVGSRLGAQTGAAPKKLGLALVGLGSYSRGQLGPALKVTQHCELRGVVTGSREKGLEWAKEYGFSEKNIFGYDTMHQIAGHRDIDIIYIVTPNGLHLEHAVAAAKAGKHVIVEKPMANTVDECDAILKACRDARVQCSIGYRLHFDPFHQELMRLAREKDFGPLLTMTGDRGFIVNAWRWRIDKKLAGGGAMMDIGIYINQAALMASDGVPPVAVTAEHIPITKPELFKDVEEGTRYAMEFPNGATLNAFTSYSHNADKFRAEGPKGFIDFRERAFTYRGMMAVTSRGLLDFGQYVNQQALQMDDFAQCVREGRPTRVPGEMGRRDMVIIEAIYEAARTGKRTLVKV